MVYDYYLVFLLLLSFVGLSAFYNQGEVGRAFFVILLCSLFIGLRGEHAGSDTLNYVDAYNAIDTSRFVYSELVKSYVINGITAAEPGFLLTSYAFKLTGASYHFYLIFICFISLAILYFGFRRITQFSLFALVLYCFSISLVSLQANVLRQSLAVAFMVLAIGFLTQNKNKKFAFFGILAGFFHISAFVVFPLFFLTFISLRIRYYFLLFIGLLAFVYSGLIVKIATLVLGGLIGNKFASYFSVGFAALLTFKFISFFMILLICLFLRHINRENFYRVNLHYITACYFCCFYLQFLFSGNEVSSERFGLYRFVLEPVIFSLIPTFFKRKELVFMYMTVLAFIYGFIVYNLSTVKYMLNSA